jgi:hypothetical protein
MNRIHFLKKYLRCSALNVIGFDDDEVNDIKKDGIKDIRTDTMWALDNIVDSVNDLTKIQCNDADELQVEIETVVGNFKTDYREIECQLNNMEDIIDVLCGFIEDLEEHLIDIYNDNRTIDLCIPLTDSGSVNELYNMVYK